MSKSVRAVIWSIIILLVIAGIVYFIGVQQQSGNTNPIKIGALFPLTGGLAQYGDVAQKSAQIAEDEINVNGGINGKKLVIDFQDHQCNPQTAVTLFQQLNSAENISIFTSVACSGTVSALAPDLGKSKSLLVGTITTANSLSGISPYFFRNWASDGAEAKILSDQIESLPIKKLGIINEETDYATGLRTSIEKNLAGTGIILAEESFTTGSTDVRTQLTKLESENVDGIFLSPQTVTTGDMILKQMAELNFKPKYVFVNDNILKSSTLLSNYGNILEGAMGGDYAPNLDKANNFLAEYKTKYGDCPQPNIAAGVYDAVNLLAQAIKINGYNAEKIKNYLNSVNYSGITGNITFDQNNNRNDANYSLFIIKNGKAILSN